MPTDKERYRFDLNGYIVVPQALDAAEVTALNEAIDRHRLEAEAERAIGFLERDPAFRALVASERVLPYLYEWLGPGLRLDHYYALFAKAGDGQLRLHGGATPYDPGQYYQVRDGRIFSGLTVVSYALTPGSAGAGFACVPGSHKAGFPVPADVAELVDRSFVTTPPLEPGDAVIFTEALTHGTLPWASAQPRRALLYKYSPGHMTWMHPRWSAELLESCTPKQRSLLEPPYYADQAAYFGLGQPDVDTYRLSR
jgi:ectoine hydroxylase-related dioxygenase (phytanoyl-CoA dioxygenase family)